MVPWKSTARWSTKPTRERRSASFHWRTSSPLTETLPEVAS